MDTLSKTAQVVKFIAQNYGHPGVPRKRLVKLIYVCDILSRQYLGAAISELTYIKDHYGPNSRELPSATQELVACDLAIELTERHENLRRILLRDTGRPMVFGFSPAEFEILDYVMANYSHMPIDEFIGDVVKETDPFQAVTIQGHRLPMELVDNRKRTEVGFNLEAIIRAEMQAAEGASITLTQLRDEIHASHPA